MPRLPDFEIIPAIDLQGGRCVRLVQGDFDQSTVYGDDPPGMALDDLRRDLRLGMGPCQAGFCGVRAAGILHATRQTAPDNATRALGAFVDERFKGVRPLLYSHQLRQFALDELIYRRVLGLDALLDLDQPQPEDVRDGTE